MITHLKRCHTKVAKGSKSSSHSNEKSKCSVDKSEKEKQETPKQNRETLAHKPGNRKPKCFLRKSKKAMQENHQQNQEDVVLSSPIKLDDSQSMDPCTGTDTKNDSNMCIKLKIDVGGSLISPQSNENDVRAMIFTQISNQIAKMIECKIVHNESIQNMDFEIGEECYELDVGKISGDGSCLFRAAAHQINGEKLNGPNQNQLTNKLRAKVVQYILANYDDFEMELKGRVFDLKSDVADMDKECKRFARTVLPKKETWGGSETMKAIVLLHQVNILIINEFGNCYYVNGFNETYGETILLAYRTDITAAFEGGGQMLRNHYDSVISIKEDTVFLIAKSLAKLYTRPDSLVQNISINDSI